MNYLERLSLDIDQFIKHFLDCNNTVYCLKL